MSDQLLIITVVPVIVVITRVLAVRLGRLLTDAGYQDERVAYTTGPRVTEETGGQLWIVDAEEACVLAKRYGRRPDGPEKILAVGDSALADEVWWATRQIGADLTTLLPGGAQVVLDHVSDACQGTLDISRPIV